MSKAHKVAPKIWVWQLVRAIQALRKQLQSRSRSWDVRRRTDLCRKVCIMCVIYISHISLYLSIYIYVYICVCANGVKVQQLGDECETKSK